MVNGVSKQITLTPASFIPAGPGGGSSNFYNVRLLHSFSDRQTLQLTGGMYDQPNDWYDSAGTGADYKTGPGSTSNDPSRSWHANALWSLSRTKAGDILAGMEFRRATASAANFSLTNFNDRDSTTSQTYAAAGKATRLPYTVRISIK